MDVTVGPNDPDGGVKDETHNGKLVDGEILQLPAEDAAQPPSPSP